MKKKKKERIEVKPLEPLELGPMDIDNRATFTDVNGEKFEFKVNDEDSVLYDIWHVDVKNKEYTDSDGMTYKFDFTTETDPTTLEEFEKALIKLYDDFNTREIFTQIQCINRDKPWWNEFLELVEKVSSFDELESFCEKNDIDESDAWDTWNFKHGPYKDDILLSY